MYTALGKHIIVFSGNLHWLFGQLHFVLNIALVEKCKLLFEPPGVIHKHFYCCSVIHALIDFDAQPFRIYVITVFESTIKMECRAF